MMKKQGFTLIELMVVVAIMMIMIVAAVSSYGNRAERDAIKKLRDDVPVFFTTAIERGYEKARAVTVEINTTSGSILIADTGQLFKLPAILQYELLKAPTITGNTMTVPTTIYDNTTFTVNDRGGIDFADGDDMLLLGKTRDNGTAVGVYLYNMQGVEFGRVNVYKGGGDTLTLEEGQ